MKLYEWQKDNMIGYLLWIRIRGLLTGNFQSIYSA